ncbi:hypothetical protein BN2475_270226 [Paraburkholderia ribeironis]|uniref:Uncharacterized protein n=1 Tax=Paraburkholderia ribeironis TaxID=1247936 RepID=A0A1N7S0U7_9BURK|nr:hypothetical protein BN2475_270226 [Paraburkholderia ribeironis]
MDRYPRVRRSAHPADRSRTRKRRARRADRRALPRRTLLCARLSAIRAAECGQGRRARRRRTARATRRNRRAHGGRETVAQVQRPRRSEVSRTRARGAGRLAGFERSRGVEARQTDRTRLRLPDHAAGIIRRRTQRFIERRRARARMTYSRLTYSRLTYGRLTYGRLTYSRLTYGRMTYGRVAYGRVTSASHPGQTADAGSLARTPRRDSLQSDFVLADGALRQFRQLTRPCSRQRHECTVRYAHESLVSVSPAERRHDDFHRNERTRRRERRGESGPGLSRFRL